jgi:hypothetical protein
VRRQDEQDLQDKKHEENELWHWRFRSRKELPQNLFPILSILLILS